MKKIILFLLLSNLLSASSWAKDAAGSSEPSTDLLSPLPNGGVTPEWCDIASAADIIDGETADQSLRHRVELYNAGENCRFYLYFLFRSQTIRLAKPLIFEKKLHDRDPSPVREVLTGTYLSGYGPGGLTDKLGITIDATAATKNEKQCAFMLKGGFAAKQQIHGLTVLVRDKARVVCDGDGNDLLDAVSPNSPSSALGRDFDFKDITVMVQAGEDPSEEPTDDTGDDDGTDGSGSGTGTNTGGGTTNPPSGDSTPTPAPYVQTGGGCELRLVPGPESKASPLIFMGLALSILGAIRQQKPSKK